MRHQFRCLYAKQPCLHLYSVPAVSAVTSVTSVPTVTSVTTVTVACQVITCETILFAILQRSCCGPSSSACHPVHFQNHFAAPFDYRSPQLQGSWSTHEHTSDLQGRAAPPTELGQGDPRKMKAVSLCLSGGGSSFLWFPVLKRGVATPATLRFIRGVQLLLQLLAK